MGCLAAYGMHWLTVLALTIDAMESETGFVYPQFKANKNQFRTLKKLANFGIVNKIVSH